MNNDYIKALAEDMKRTFFTEAKMPEEGSPVVVFTAMRPKKDNVGKKIGKEFTEVEKTTVKAVSGRNIVVEHKVFRAPGKSSSMATKFTDKGTHRDNSFGVYYFCVFKDLSSGEMSKIQQEVHAAIKEQDHPSQPFMIDADALKALALKHNK